nr:hypothetical protein KPHV_87030 [Kitasatospora purpeofusca]
MNARPDPFAFAKALHREADTVLRAAGCTPVTYFPKDYFPDGASHAVPMSHGYELGLTSTMTSSWPPPPLTPQAPRFLLWIATPGALTHEQAARADAGPESREDLLAELAVHDSAERVVQRVQCAQALTDAGWTAELDDPHTVVVTAPPFAVHAALSAFLHDDPQ